MFLSVTVYVYLQLPSYKGLFGCERTCCCTFDSDGHLEAMNTLFLFLFSLSLCAIVFSEYFCDLFHVLVYLTTYTTQCLLKCLISVYFVHNDDECELDFCDAF